MIKVENIEVNGWEAVIRGMRNPLNSWSKSDSIFNAGFGSNSTILGEDDLKLMKSLVKAGTDHSKFMRMITVTMDITAPLYWISEHDTYKVGTTRNSCSFMHKGVNKQFKLEDFSFNNNNEKLLIETIIPYLNDLRDNYLKTRNESVFESIRQLLPSGYNQRYTWQANYQVCRNIYKSRRNHRLKEWKDYCKILESLPYSELITT